MFIDLEAKEFWKANKFLDRHKALSEPMGPFNKDDLREVITFVHYYSDPEDSPISDERDFGVRLKTAVELTKFKNKKLEADLKKYLTEDTEITNWTTEVMSTYLMVCNPTLYRSWFTLKVNYERVSRFLMTPLDARDMEKAAIGRLNISKALADDSVRISDMEMKLFANEEIARRINEQAMEDALAGPAELHAVSIDDELAEKYGHN